MPKQVMRSPTVLPAVRADGSQTPSCKLQLVPDLASLLFSVLFCVFFWVLASCNLLLASK